MFFIYACGFFGGLLVGSFLSVVVARYEAGETVVRGRSHCRTCGATIRWYDNIPLFSYIFLCGCCRACAERISVVYPAIELTTAVTFTILSGMIYSHGGSVVYMIADFIFFGSIAAGLIAIFFYDLRTMQIPMNIAWIVIGVLCIYMSTHAGVWQDVSVAQVFSRGIGGAVGFLFLYLLSTLSGEKWMGAGDAYIGLIGGLAVGWSAVIFFLTVSFGLGAVVGIVLIALNVRGRKDAVPFAPFLICGIAVTFLFPLLFPHTALLLPYF